MLFPFLTIIGVSLILQQKIRQEYEGELSWLEKRRALAKIEEHFAIENTKLDDELGDLLAQHRVLVAGRERLVCVSIVDDDLYQEAVEELERYLSEDTLAEAIDDLEKGHDKKKKKGL